MEEDERQRKRHSHRDASNTVAKKPKGDGESEAAESKRKSDRNGEDKYKQEKHKSDERAERKERDRDREKSENKKREKQLYIPKQSDEEGHLLVKCGENITDRFKILDLMGEGTFAKVIEAWDRKKLERVAIKIVRSTEKYTRDAEFELAILKKIRRADTEDQFALIKVIEDFTFADQEKSRSHLCIVFPKLGPSLLDFINKCGQLQLPIVAHITKQCADALNFLHTELKMIHTDLKPENILFRKEGHQKDADGNRVPTTSDVTIIDFGGCTDERHHFESVVSTRHYRSPEVILGAGWMFPTDVWSLGCIVYELYTGELLFDTHENREHLAMMEKQLGTFPDWMAKGISDSSKKYFVQGGTALRWPEMASSSRSIRRVDRLTSIKDRIEDGDLLDLLYRMLDYDKKRRITAKEILQHQFIRKHYV